MAFSPPGRVPADSGAAAAAVGTEWPPETPVERLLDDVSDIWAPARVVAYKPGGSYDIQYCDGDQKIEKDVGPYELRLRREQSAAEGQLVEPSSK
mmetsp:Transcript_105994/g.304609  ORF Transcript_105994/g.304609 Transcript_105994/m.304609 type:complete len:95 (+) Transcript_105994:105-389(+)